MSYTINSIYFNEFDYIAIFVKGIVNAELAKKVIEEAFEKIEKHSCKKVFFDVSDTVSFATTSENYNLAETLPSFLSDAELTWAVYYRNDAHMYEFINSLVVKNNINNLLICPNRDLCMKWLFGQ
jgi:hypothetical protein